MTHPTPGLSEADKALREQLAASLLDRPGRHAQIIAYKKADELAAIIAAAIIAAAIIAAARAEGLKTEGVIQ